MGKIKEKVETIVNTAIQENGWEKLSSKEYSEYKTVTEIGKRITINGKNLKGKEVNILLEEMGFVIKEDNKRTLTDKGKKYGRYAICIKLNNNKPLITDQAYAKYKIEVIDEIKAYLISKGISEKEIIIKEVEEDESK